MLVVRRKGGGALTGVLSPPRYAVPQDEAPMFCLRHSPPDGLRPPLPPPPSSPVGESPPERSQKLCRHVVCKMLHCGGTQATATTDCRGRQVFLGKPACELKHVRTRPGRVVRTPVSVISSPLLLASPRESPSHDEKLTEDWAVQRWAGAVVASVATQALRRAVQLHRAEGQLRLLLLPLLRRHVRRVRQRKAKAARARAASRCRVEDVRLLAEQLSVAPFFSDWGDASVEEIARSSERVEVEAGVPVYRAGDSGDSMYFIAAGHARSVSEGEESALPPGSVFGIIALLGREVRGHSVFAVSDCELLKITAAVLQRIWRRLPADASEAFLAEVLRRKESQLVLLHPLKPESVAQTTLLRSVSAKFPGMAVGRSIPTRLTAKKGRSASIQVPASMEQLQKDAATIATPLSVPPGHRVVLEGTSATALFYLVSGRLGAVKMVGGKRRDCMLTEANSQRGAAVLASLRHSVGRVAAGAAVRKAIRTALATQPLTVCRQLRSAVGDTDAQADGTDLDAETWLSWCESLQRADAALLPFVLSALENRVETETRRRRATGAPPLPSCGVAEGEGVVLTESKRALAESAPLSARWGRMMHIETLQRLIDASEITDLTTEAQPEQQSGRRLTVSIREVQTNAKPLRAVTEESEIIVQQVAPGTWICDSAPVLMDGAPLPVGYMALGACDLWVIDAKKLLHVIRSRHPSVWEVAAAIAKEGRAGGKEQSGKSDKSQKHAPHSRRSPVSQRTRAAGRMLRSIVQGRQRPSLESYKIAAERTLESPPLRLYSCQWDNPPPAPVDHASLSQRPVLRPQSAPQSRRGDHARPQSPPRAHWCQAGPVRGHVGPLRWRRP
eukprot:TRINITY_DN12086_c0_g1_i1.p1 TRINITY_DN12086_c0_g1~~TRINITY_DN12086_c0_g1_i1.p1  ORF type:complete len:875 (+),score=142.70 TRINITY_DN12086_c0_g1_i1:92-2626(+)